MSRRAIVETSAPWRESRSIIRERQFSTREWDVENLFSFLRVEGFTGRVVVDMLDGGVRCMRSEDSPSEVAYLTRQADSH